MSDSGFLKTPIRIGLLPRQLEKVAAGAFCATQVFWRNVDFFGSCADERRSVEDAVGFLLVRSGCFVAGLFVAPKVFVCVQRLHREQWSCCFF
jgi:hypothetical protein